jgi:hypothetical protein
MVTKVKMAQGAVVPFVYPFAQWAAAGAPPAGLATATNEAARRMGIEISGKSPSFVLGNLFTQNTANVANAGGGILTTLAQELMNPTVERIDSYLGHRAALSRGNVFAIVDELIPVIEAGSSNSWGSAPANLLQDWDVYNAARTGYGPGSHSFMGPQQVAWFAPRYAAKVGLYAARKLLANTGVGKYLNLRSLLKPAGGK